MDDVSAPWLNAIWKAKRGNNSDITALLRRGEPINSAAREFIADWLDHTSWPHREQKRPESDEARAARRSLVGMIEYLMNDNPHFGRCSLDKAAEIAGECHGYTKPTAKQYYKEAQRRKKRGE